MCNLYNLIGQLILMASLWLILECLNTFNIWSFTFLNFLREILGIHCLVLLKSEFKLWSLSFVRQLCDVDKFLHFLNITFTLVGICAILGLVALFILSSLFVLSWLSLSDHSCYRSEILMLASAFADWSLRDFCVEALHFKVGIYIFCILYYIMLMDWPFKNKSFRIFTQF